MSAHHAQVCNRTCSRESLRQEPRVFARPAPSGLLAWLRLPLAERPSSSCFNPPQRIGEPQARKPTCWKVASWRLSVVWSWEEAVLAKIAVTSEPGMTRPINGIVMRQPARRVLAHGDGWSVSHVVCDAGPHDRRFEEQLSNVCIAIVTAG